MTCLLHVHLQHVCYLSLLQLLQVDSSESERVFWQNWADQSSVLLEVLDVDFMSLCQHSTVLDKLSADIISSWSHVTASSLMIQMTYCIRTILTNDAKDFSSLCQLSTCLTKTVCVAGDCHPVGSSTRGRAGHSSLPPLPQAVQGLGKNLFLFASS